MKRKIADLEASLKGAEIALAALYRAGQIPSHYDYEEIDKLKAALRVARRVASMEKTRTEPKKERKITVLLSLSEYEALTVNAKQKGLILSKYIRYLLKKGLEVEERR